MMTVCWVNSPSARRLRWMSGSWHGYILTDEAQRAPHSPAVPQDAGDMALYLPGGR